MYLKRFWTISGWVRLELLGKEKKETYINWKNDKQNDFFSTPGILIMDVLTWLTANNKIGIRQSSQ